MAQLVTGLTAEAVRRNRAAVDAEIAAAARVAGRDPGEVEVVAAVKYVALDELSVLAQAGVTVLGENRAQDLAAKHAAHPDLFAWEFIGQLQSRKVKQVAPLVRRIHSLASDSALAQLRRHAAPGLEVLVEVNVAGEAGKGGLEPSELGAFIERARAVEALRVVGLMTMPPLAVRPDDSRPSFAALRELAAAHELPQLSMGTTQDFGVAVEEGATLVRVGTRLYRPS
jgi:pyridoxal phosphate enzyme (YggS family)